MTAETPSVFRRFALAALILLLVAVALMAVLTSNRDPGTLLNIFTTRFLGIFLEAAPFLLLGALASGLIDSFVRPDDIARLMPRNPAIATVVGAFMGFIFPVCECGVVPVVRRLYTKGLPISVGVTFLLAAPVINPVVLVSTYVAYGFGPVLIGRFVITIVVAIIIGLIFAVAARPRDVLRASTLAMIPPPVVAGGSPEASASDIIPIYTRAPRKPLGVGLRDAMGTAADDFFDMGRYLIIGSMLAAAMQTFIPQEAMATLGSGPVTSVLVMQALAFLLSVCSTVDAFLSLAFVNTFTPGSIMAFLTFGPMVDIKSMLMFAGVFKPRVVAYLIILPFLLTLLIGVWINLNVPL
ncbi:MAG: permease [Anaerolineae bacterium]|nr:permease [Anaerolineae bacterium]